MLTSRRFILSLIALIMLFILGIYKDVDVSIFIMSIALGIGAINAYEAKQHGKK